MHNLQLYFFPWAGLKVYERLVRPLTRSRLDLLQKL
jgi:hypothetical protein